MDCPPACYFASVQDGKQEIYLEWPYGLILVGPGLLPMLKFILHKFIRPMKLDLQFLAQNSGKMMRAGGYYSLFINTSVCILLAVVLKLYKVIVLLEYFDLLPCVANFTVNSQPCCNSLPILH